jgi:hypothetical protein
MPNDKNLSFQQSPKDDEKSPANPQRSLAMSCHAKTESRPQIGAARFVIDGIKNR